MSIEPSSSRVTVTVGSPTISASVAFTFCDETPGKMRQFTVASAFWGRALRAWPPLSMVATQGVCSAQLQVCKRSRLHRSEGAVVCNHHEARRTVDAFTTLPQRGDDRGAIGSGEGTKARDGLLAATNVPNRLGETELVQEAGQRGLSLRVMRGGRVALTSTSDLSEAAVTRTVTDAMELLVTRLAKTKTNGFQTSAAKNSGARSVFKRSDHFRVSNNFFLNKKK